MAYKKTSEASLRKHDQNVKVKPVSKPSAKAPSKPASKPKPAPASKPKAPASRPSSPKGQPKKASGGTKITGRPDAPISPNRKSSRGSIRIGPASGGPLKSSGTIVGKDVTKEYSKTGLGRVVKKSNTTRPVKYKLKG